MIYEDIEQQQTTDLHLLVLPDGSRWAKGTVADSLQVTRVNRQLRQESVPIMYQHLEFTIITDGEEYRRQANLWAQKMDATILEAARGFTFRSGLGGCSYDIRFQMIDVDLPLQSRKFCDWCRTKEALAKLGENKVLELEVCGGKRIMTREVLKSLVGTFCTLSKLYYR